MRRKDFTTAPISIETCYAEGLPQTYMPVLLHVSGNKFVYHKEIDECTNEITEGFCVCDEWHHTPVLLNSEKQRALLHYFSIVIGKQSNMQEKMTGKELI